MENANKISLPQKNVHLSRFTIILFLYKKTKNIRIFLGKFIAYLYTRHFEIILKVLIKVHFKSYATSCIIHLKRSIFFIYFYYFFKNNYLFMHLF